MRRVCLLLLLLTASPAFGQLSPGALSRPHAELEGNTHCVECHGAGRESMAPRCLHCHEGIAALIEAGRGLHAREGHEDCERCHPEHAGREFDLIDWGREGREAFDHPRTGWPLKGAHGELRCEQCHRTDFLDPELRGKLRRRTGAGMAGTATACAACHEDLHRGSAGVACARCHDERAFRPAPGFDHAQSVYPLKGRHEQVACAKCHAPVAGGEATPGGLNPVFAPLEHADCGACHRDVHQGRLGARCSGCHTEEGFTVVSDAGFRHELTRFPLRGAHGSVRCERCHDEQTAWGARPPFAECRLCHADPHAGQATRAGKVVDCAACHSERAWRPSTYDADDHAGARYPLEGRHREVPCGKCHPRAPETGVSLRPAHDRCVDCHDADAHGPQLDHREDAGCEGCHTPGGWRPSLFTALEHASLGLPLEGAHRSLDCRRCHGAERRGLKPVTGPLGSAGVALRTGEAECGDCHFDPHAGRFAPEEGGCAGCHCTERWRPARVDATQHARFAFALEGAHRAVPCVLCHSDLARPPAATSLVAAADPPAPLDLRARFERCADCHVDAHGSQFVDRDCDRCHGSESFAPATRFDHDRDTRFPLGGAHRRAPCAKCHPSETRPDGGGLVRYRPLDPRCESCHGIDRPFPLPEGREGASP